MNSFCDIDRMSRPSKIGFPGGRLVQPHQRQADGRLAGPRLADQAERLAFGKAERDVLDRLELAPAEEPLA
jgi:hypothetical protein